MPPDKAPFDGDRFDDPRLIKGRDRVISALEEGPAPVMRLLLAKLRGLRACGEYVVAVVVKEGRITRVLRNQCQCRGCPVCDSFRAARTRAALAPLIEQREKSGARFSMITVTMPHGPKDLAQKLVCLLFRAMSEFQRAPEFQAHVLGWARGVEVPWSAKNGFHPHAHYFVEASKWRKEEIKAVWTRCMLSIGGPLVLPNGTHVKGIKNAGKGLLEAIGYPFKVQDQTHMPARALCELLFATKGRHLTQLCQPWGRSVKQLMAQADAEAEGRTPVDGADWISYDELNQRLREGDYRAYEILLAAGSFLIRSGATGSVVRELMAHLRTEANYHGWLRKDDCATRGDEQDVA